MLPLSLPPLSDTRTKVSVLLVTYNHEKYIAQAIESVLMQRVNFDYEIVIIEDCSTDSTRDIVVDFQKRYPDRIRLVLAEKNKCTNEDFAAAFQASPSQYIAWLDGDDYWTSPHKLQRQADFLDAHPECAICFHNVVAFYEDGSREPWYRNPVDQKEISTPEDLWACNFIASCSSMFRKGLLSEFPAWYCTDITGDWTLNILFAQHGKIGYLDEVMGAYRIHSGGYWSSLSEIQKLEGLIEFYETMNANLGFRYDEAIKTMISRCRVQLAVERSGLPHDVTVIVVNEGDDPLLYWEGRQGWHFPQNEDGTYAGYHPADSAEAIAHLEELRARGGGYLLFPNTAFWWLDYYKELRQHLGTWHRRVWKDEHCVIYKLLDMPLVEVTDVSLADRNPQQLWGRYIDLPKPNTQTAASTLDFTSWVLGLSSPAVAVELVHEGNVIRRVPMNHRRPDIAEAFPDVPEAENSGFRGTVSVLGTTPEFELRLQAVLQDQSRVQIGVIRGRRRWGMGEDERVGAALVSVVIPCYNQAHFLSEAIESVLAQSYPHFEVVVVDDGSTDNTQEVAARYPGVRYVRQENQGLAGARNTGIRRSNGSYLVFLDADDRLLPDALEVGLKYLKEHPECAFVYGRWKLIAFDGSPLQTSPQPLIEEDHYGALLHSCYISAPATVMYQRIMLEYVGKFDTSVSPSADYDLYLRIARDYPIYCHGEVVAEYRRHGANMTHNSALMLESEVTVLRAQRKYVRRKKQYKEAYEAGMKHSREYFGQPLAEEVRARVRGRKWRQAIRGVPVLLRYHPQGFTSVLRDAFS